MERIPNTPILIIAFLISLLSTINVNGQTDSTKNSNTHSYFTLNLLSPLNTQSPRWRIGYIKDIDEKWKAGLDMGYGNRNLLFSDYGDNISKDYQLWEIRPEIYYIINPKRKTKKYFSLELFYINHTDIFYSGSYSSVNNESISYDQSDYKREKYGLNLKYGFIIYSKKRLGLNLYTGLGMKIRKNTFSNVLNPNLVDLGPEKGDMFGFDNYKNVEGSKLGANFSFGFKLYYKLNN